MSWIGKLYETYENNTSQVDKKGKPPLLPVGHTTKEHAHILIVLDKQGDFIRASVIGRSNAQTIIPVTEKLIFRILPSNLSAPSPLSIPK